MGIESVLLIAVYGMYISQTMLFGKSLILAYASTENPNYFNSGHIYPTPARITCKRERSKRPVEKDHTKRGGRDV
jgi:hypothetical protein